MPFDKCPKCGYSEDLAQKALQTKMTTYVNQKTGKEVVINRDDEKFTNKEGVLFIRKDKIVAAPKVATPSTPKEEVKK